MLDGQIEFVTSRGGSDDVLGPIIDSKQWTHLAGTWDGVTKSLYVDGVLRATAESEGVAFDANDIVLGADRDAGALANPMLGALDDVRIYDRSITAEEVALLASSP